MVQLFAQSITSRFMAKAPCRGGHASTSLRNKVLLTGSIYFLYLIFGTIIFQRIEGPYMNATCESTKKFINDKRRLLSSDIFYRFKYNERFCEFIAKLLNRWQKWEEVNKSPQLFTVDEVKIVRMLSEKFITTKCRRDDFERIDDEIKNNPEWSKVWNPRFINLAIRQIKLGKFKEKKDHILTGPELQIMMKNTTEFATRAHTMLYESCFRDDWSFDNTFLFMGSVATTIGYGHITPKSAVGKACCVGFTLISVPLFAILLQFISSYIDEQLTNLVVSVNRTLRLANKKLVSERSVRFYYFFYGCIMFVFVPSLLFIQAEEDWTYLDAVYFSVISLTKIGFGDYVPSTTPPNKFANTLLNATSCLANLTSPNPHPPGVQMPEVCHNSQWPIEIKIIFGLYRVLLNFWMLLGLSFFGSLISFMTRGINKFLMEKAPFIFIKDSESPNPNPAHGHRRSCLGERLITERGMIPFSVKKIKRLPQPVQLDGSPYQKRRALAQVEECHVQEVRVTKRKTIITKRNFIANDLKVVKE